VSHMRCPKCRSDDIELKDEEFIQSVKDGVIVKQSYVCEKCSAQFSRIVTKSPDGKEKASDDFNKEGENLKRESDRVSRLETIG
jgi:transposase-like protein